jgi:hypothetical protein
LRVGHCGHHPASTPGNLTDTPRGHWQVVAGGRRRGTLPTQRREMNCSPAHKDALVHGGEARSRLINWEGQQWEQYALSGRMRDRWEAPCCWGSWDCSCSAHVTPQPASGRTCSQPGGISRIALIRTIDEPTRPERPGPVEAARSVWPIDRCWSRRSAPVKLRPVRGFLHLAGVAPAGMARMPCG